jgi:pSer/pThr/pTyr-binding forkhead associated (FHA) protein
LVVAYRDELIGEYVIDKDNLVIGRAPNCDIRLDYQKVSGTHASVVSTRRESFIIDLGSTNGTFINGKAVKKKRLRSGDVISIARHLKIQYFDSEKAKNDSIKRIGLSVVRGRDDTVDSEDYADSVKTGKIK